MSPGQEQGGGMSFPIPLWPKGIITMGCDLARGENTICVGAAQPCQGLVIPHGAFSCARSANPHLHKKHSLIYHPPLARALPGVSGSGARANWFVSSKASGIGDIGLNSKMVLIPLFFFPKAVQGRQPTHSQ